MSGTLRRRLPLRPSNLKIIVSSEPGTINRTTDRNGNLRETKIGENGLAVRERHYSDHGNSSKHSVPHDHEIMWDGKSFDLGKGAELLDGHSLTSKHTGV